MSVTNITMNKLKANTAVKFKISDIFRLNKISKTFQNQAPKYMKPAAKLNQNVDLEEMVGALKESMEESIIAIESVTKVE